MKDAMNLLKSQISSTASGENYLLNEAKTIERRGRIQSIITSFTGYAIGIIFIIGCAQLAFLKHSLRQKKII